MAIDKEIEKIDQAAEYFNRYFEFEDAVTVSKENKEYLKTYIHDNDYVVKNFDLKKKIARALGISALIGIAALLILWLLLGSDLLIAAGIAAGVIFICAAAFGIALNKYRLTAAEQKQVEVNDGINEQIIMLDDRIKQLERQRDDYYKALEKRVTFMSLEYMRNVDQIKQFLVDGKAETCEEAEDMFEESMLFQQMTDIMSKSEKMIPVQDDKERFGDPLKIIKENKKKRRKEKRRKK
ncbi:hypothetical protein [Ruminococcus sp.]|uniref:hypothetical protein n=1 Tax=Ruminococcus sp. TaxID=41978 RepID=UPI0025E2316D|nr:hypothetical protein [Ruminococcus sp.]